MRNFVFGILEDNIGLIIYNWVGKPFYSSEPLFFLPFEFLAKIFDSFFIYHLYVVFGLIFTLITSYYFFNEMIKNKPVSILVSISFIFSYYFYYHSQSHVILIQVWCLILFLINFIQVIDKERSTFIQKLWVGILLSITTLISNYLGFIGILFFVSYIISKIVFKKYENTSIRSLLTSSLIITSTFLTIILVVNYKFFIANYTKSENYKSNLKIERPIEDFFIFSSRPWYYFLPSVDSYFYGRISEKLQPYNFYRNYLTDNYFKSEQSASFLGITNIILGIIGFRYFYKKNKPQSLKILFSIFLLFLFTLPPYVKIFNFSIYFPSYLFYLYTPMFRSISRVSILIYLLYLVFSSYGYIHLLKKFQFKNRFFVVFIVFILSISEFIAPIKIVNSSTVPNVYEEFNSSKNSNIFIYPNSKVREGFFWSYTHQNKIINFFSSPKVLINNIEYSVEQINKNANSCEGLKIIYSLGTNYLIYFYSLDDKNASSFFSNNLKKTRTFDEYTEIEINEYYKGLIRMQNIGNVRSNTAEVYSLENFNPESCKDVEIK